MNNESQSSLKIEPFNKVEDLIHHVMLKTSSFHSVNGAIFRGEHSAKANFELLPSALRKINRIPCDRPTPQYEEDRLTHEELEFKLILSEYLALKQFYKKADLNGFALPRVDTFEKHTQPPRASEYLDGILDSWIPDDVLEIAGLAQHYGIPTRLLDWSRSFMTALYFASSGAVKDFYKCYMNNEERRGKWAVLEEKSNDHLVIWALEYDMGTHANSYARKIGLSFHKPLYNRNPNLTAQIGIFTYFPIIKPAGGWGDPSLRFDEVPLDKKIEGLTDNQIHLIKYTLPVKEASRALYLLDGFGVNASKIYPGLKGVTEAIQEENMIEVIHKHWQYL